MPDKVSIKPNPIPLERAIEYYENLNDIGKAGFILTLQEEDRPRFLDAYEEHYYRNDPHNRPKSKISNIIKETN